MKDSNLAKFGFLAAVVAAALFSRAIYPAANGAAGSSSSAGAGDDANLSSGGGAASQVPLFEFPPAPASVSAAAGDAPDGNAAETGAVATTTFAAVPPPALPDAATMIVNLSDDSVIEAANPDRRWPTASLAKLMSATIVLDKIPTSTAIAITSDIFAVDPTEKNLVVGGRYSVEDLLHAMLLPSSNVAAQANAVFYGLNDFLAEMNARAASWGMTNTHYDDPSGISAGDESTASDLAKLAAIVYARYPRILQISNTPSYPITDLASGGTSILKSINDFAGKPGFVGGKTGYTAQADGNLLSVLQSGDRPPVVAIVLGSNDRFGDTQKLYDWFKANFK